MNKTEYKNKKNTQKNSSITLKKLSKQIENNCLEKLCVYCLLDCKKHNKSINNSIGQIKVKNNYLLYYN
jgi:hypothetical protein